MRVVVAPTSVRGTVDRLPDLAGAGSANRPARLMKCDAGRVPVEPAMVDDPARPGLEIVDDVLVTDLEHAAARQRLAPMRHEPVVLAVVTAELGEIVSELLRRGEQLGIAGQAGVARSGAAGN